MSFSVDSRPWVEKYRPDSFTDIVLDDLNRQLLMKVIESRKFPNLLLYGPPGTGKTTTVVNLVNEFRANMGETGPGHVIHLNASDERGVDIVRGPISQFAQSQNMFTKGNKFIILDEADYMTAAAQHSLRQLLQTYPNVKFCLICNYVSKIDLSLRNEFVRIRFNHLPENLIDNFLADISEKEGIGLSMENIEDIRKMFGSDMRSMINFIQSCQNAAISINVIKHDEWETLYDACKSQSTKRIGELLRTFVARGFNIKNVIRDLANHIILNNSHCLTIELLQNLEFIVHLDNSDTNAITDFFIRHCVPLIKEP